jgi:molecular chaperone DnaJ
VSRNASDDDIKKRYRRLALQHHPDKDKSEGAADRFRRIKLAYETLSDSALRRQYDFELRRS